MLKIIQFFGGKKSETLISFSQVFLQLNSEYCEENRVCSTTLAKYVLEKWRCQIPDLKDKRIIREKSNEYYVFNLLKSTLSNFKQGIEISKNREICYQTVNH